jgi:hypothetical protein
MSRLDPYDVLALVGWLMLGYGLGSISVPLAAGVLGLLLILAGLTGAWRKGGRT